ncbi:MAG: DUF2312 domain-containing protein [Rhizobiaceae bacterium]|nr:DUF2312 domain-containing protein [Rhizobiaceae bacterium]
MGKDYKPDNKPKKKPAKKKTEKPAKATSGNLVAREQLRTVVERIERLEEEKKAIAEDVKEVYAEAKMNGFDPKVLREVIKIRKMDKAERDEFDAVRDLYLQALGMLPDFEPAGGDE